MNALRLPQVKALPVLVLFALQACTAGPTLTVTPVVEPPAATPVPLSEQVQLTNIAFREEGQSPAYVITAQTPMFTGVDHPHVKALNKAADQLIQEQVENFRETILAQAYAKPGSPNSSFHAQYTFFQRDGIWSFKFDFFVFADPAFPNHYTLTLNYDLEQGRELSLSDLFPPDTDYLETISRYCVVELSKRNIGFYGSFQQGAKPEPENYRNWNIEAKGLLITFGEFQVAPYAAGQQIVIVPYSEIMPLKPKISLAYQP